MAGRCGGARKARLEHRDARRAHEFCKALGKEARVPNRVLVVDDDPLACELIQEVLGSVEIEACVFTDSSRAAARLKEEKFDAAFLDVRMPPPDGIELVQQMRASGINQKTLIVMITGEDDHSFLTRAFQVGVNFVLFKPVSRQSLLRLMRVTQGPVQSQRRHFTRVKLRCKGVMESGQDRLQGTTVDVSVSGMLVQASRVYPVGSHVQLSLELRPDRPPLRVTACVARTVGDDCMGLQLENVGEAESDKLQEVLLPLILAETKEVPQASPSI